MEHRCKEGLVKNIGLQKQYQEKYKGHRPGIRSDGKMGTPDTGPGAWGIRHWWWGKVTTNRTKDTKDFSSPLTFRLNSGEMHFELDNKATEVPPSFDD